MNGYVKDICLFKWQEARQPLENYCVNVYFTLLPHNMILFIIIFQTILKMMTIFEDRDRFYLYFNLQIYR